MKEYELAHAHVFHDDAIDLQMSRVMLTTQGVGIAFSASTLSADASISTGATIGLSMFGLLLSFAWLSSMFRMKVYIMSHGRRIEEIESYLEKVWKLEVDSPRLRLAAQERLSKEIKEAGAAFGYLQRIRATYTFAAIPVCTGLYWLTVPFWL